MCAIRVHEVLNSDVVFNRNSYPLLFHSSPLPLLSSPTHHTTGFENVDRLNKGGAASGDGDGFRLIFLNIDNIHAMRNSLQGLGAAVQVGSSNNDDVSEAWSEALHKTKWLQVRY